MEPDRISVVWLKILVSLTIGCPCSWGLTDTTCSQGSLSTKISASPLGSRVWAGVTARHAPGAAASSAAADRISRRKSWVLCESRRILGKWLFPFAFLHPFCRPPLCYLKKRYRMNATNAIFPETENRKTLSLTVQGWPKQGEREWVTRECCPIIFLNILPMIVACWAIHNLLQRCLENPEYTFQSTKNLLQFPPHFCVIWLQKSQVPSVENDGITTSIALMQIKTNLGTSACHLPNGGDLGP